MARDPVQGFMFESVAETGEFASRNGTICQIIERAESDEDLLEYGPAFRVRFGDDFEAIVYSGELHPWYPID